jgi:pimeloyl-ACP methyl ester carboxylesterase
MIDPLQAGFDEFLRRSIERPGQSRFVDATGIRLHYLEWEGPPGAPALLLLHGFLAHAHWWDFIAPWLAEDFRIIAPDFGGMGDSGHRDAYEHQLFIDEIGAILQRTGIAPCTVVGHSFGGRAMLHACQKFPALISRGIVVDSRLPTPDDPMRGFAGSLRPKKRYPDEAAILHRFVLQPEEPAPAAALAHMGRHSARRDGDAWIWKFDEKVTHLFRDLDESSHVDEYAQVSGIRQPIDVICGGESRVVSPARAARMIRSLPTARGPIVLPCSYHHLSVGQPLALLAALRSLLRSDRA